MYNRLSTTNKLHSHSITASSCVGDHNMVGGLDSHQADCCISAASNTHSTFSNLCYKSKDWGDVDSH